MKKILMVSDHFLNGGLETHILTYAAKLRRRGYRVYLATKSDRQDYIAYDNFENVYFLNSSKAKNGNEFVYHVELLSDIVKKEVIDIIHAHPFFSLVEAFFVSQECHVPYIVTMHGPLSLGGYTGIIYELFLRTVLLKYALPIVVSEELRDMLASYSRDITVLPNPIDIDKFTVATTVGTCNEKCAIVSRLDEDKLAGVYDFLDKAKSIGCQKVVVYGNGNGEASFEEYCKQFSRDMLVERYGFCNNIAYELNKGYGSVAGMGRVVLEAASMNIPVILTGYDGIKGLVDEELLGKALYTNFSGRGLPTITAEQLEKECTELAKNPEKYQLRSEIETHFSAENIIGNYIDIVENIKFDKCDFYQEMQKLFMTQKNIKREDLFASQKIFDDLISMLANDHSLGKNTLLYKVEYSTKQLEKKENDIAQYKDQLNRMENEIIMIKQQKKELEDIAARQDQQITELNRQLDTIYSSNIWKIAQKYYAFKEVKALQPLGRIGRSVKRYGSVTTLKKIGRKGLEQIKKLEYEKTNKKQLQEILAKYPKETIIILPMLVDWHIPLFQRPQHLAKNLANQGFLYFYCTGNAQYDHISGFEKIEDRCFVTNRFDLVDKIENRQKFYDLSSTDNITDWAFVKKRLDLGHGIIYQYIDEISDNLSGFEIPQKTWEKHNNILKDERCIVIPSATKLENNVKEHRSKNFKLVTNGVEIEHFTQQIVYDEYPSEIKKVADKKRPIIGYFGAFATWFDYELIKHLASMRKDLEIVLLGWDYDGSIKVAGFEKYENINVLGPIPYQELPRYAACFDVSTIPFVINEITESTSPIKLFEYMAMGKPIITTDMPECRKYKSVLIGKDHDDFISQINKALKLREDHKYLAILEKEAIANSWEAKAKDIAQMIEQQAL